MLKQSISEHIRAGFSGIWVQSYEHEEALMEVYAACKDDEWKMLKWDIDRGLSEGLSAAGDGNGDPTSALKALQQSGTEGHVVLCLPNFHKLIGNVDVLQCVANTIAIGKSTGRVVVVLSCGIEIPVELQKLFVVIDHPLPTRDELKQIAKDIAGDNVDELPTGQDFERLVDAAAGLTRYEAENSFALSITRSGKIEPTTVWELKSQMLKKAGTLSLHRGSERFVDLGGLDAMKGFCKAAMGSTHKLAKPKGVLLLGVPGAGKSAFAKALGNETGRPTVTLDFGALMGSLVGQTEERTRQALQIVDAMAPCVLFVDEIEKGLSGAGGEHNGDNGVSDRMLGTLLTWLNDHTSDVFFIGTCNDITKLTSVSAGAFTRAERFDGIFFIDLPGGSERMKIWDIYRKIFGLVEDETWVDVDSTGWTGAEIKSCCRLAAMLGQSIEQASRRVIPVSRTSGHKITALREWADGKAWDANKPYDSEDGIYRRQDVASNAPSITGTRKVARPVG